MISDFRSFAVEHGVDKILKKVGFRRTIWVMGELLIELLRKSYGEELTKKRMADIVRHLDFKLIKHEWISNSVYAIFIGVK
jgi:hypothetical protein